MSATKKAYSVFAVAAMFSIPALCIVFGSLSLVHGRQIAQHGVTTKAYVERNIDGPRGGPCESADVSYSTVSGVSEQGTVDTDGCLRVGSLVTVIYDPNVADVVVLKNKAGGSTSDSGGALWTGLVLLVFEGTAVGWAVLKKGRRGGTLAEHIVERRSPVGIVASGALTAGALFATAYYALGTGSPDFLGFLIGFIGILPFGYLAVPRLGGMSDGGRGRHWLRGVAWTLCAGILLIGAPTVRDVWMKMYGQPVTGVVTHVEKTHDQDGRSRNYTVQLADGQILPLGDISQDEVGRRSVGDRIEVDVDPHGLFDPEAARSLSVGFDLIVPTGILLLVLLNVGAAARRRRDEADDAHDQAFHDALAAV
ncbi:DUF3592 domain-containing protein [Jatrophihabitans endophyticus]|uniref:DUF3592 domain-containing protein n=1 Tax=Jatrophihabitans endophyticus TaxID=1206085 RepID=UPI0019E266C3|nr:DUF3592 domain-containing protein [Jatrophihabitans endophyticus]MBE7187406.1 hypothetical protein [Jatrophihabitans endophyticus]